MWRLFYPLRYLALQNRTKAVVDIVPTVLLAAAIALPYIFLHAASFFRGGGFLDKLLALSSALTGFYVAALVAASTFAQPDLDKPMTEGVVYTRRKSDDGTSKLEALSRREFACSIFGYLAFTALLLSLIAATLPGISAQMARLVFSALAGLPHLDRGITFLALRGILIGVVALAVAHIAVVTCLGLYYLMERLHYRQPRVVTLKPVDKTAA